MKMLFSKTILHYHESRNIVVIISVHRAVMIDLNYGIQFQITSPSWSHHGHHTHHTLNLILDSIQVHPVVISVPFKLNTHFKPCHQLRPIIIDVAPQTGFLV